MEWVKQHAKQHTSSSNDASHARRDCSRQASRFRGVLHSQREAVQRPRLCTGCSIGAAQIHSKHEISWLEVHRTSHDCPPGSCIGDSCEVLPLLCLVHCSDVDVAVRSVSLEVQPRKHHGSHHRPQHVLAGKLHLHGGNVRLPTNELTTPSME